MRFKIDENIHEEAAALLRSHGHDAVSVYDQRLIGVADEDLWRICALEERVIVTFDVRFAETARRRVGGSGIILLRLVDQSRPSLVAALRRILGLLTDGALGGRIWVVDESRIRVRSL